MIASRQGRIITARSTMHGSDFDELAFFRAISASGARALLIGRRALVVLGLPVLTADYDFWLHFDDVERFNDSGAAFDLVPTHAPDEARQRGRYALENLVVTKRFASRPKDLEDIRMLEILRREKGQ